MPVDPHYLAEQRSLAAHRLIAERLEREPGLVDEARAWLEARVVEGGARPYAETWREILSRDIGEIARAIVDPSERGRALRQCTPFAGALDSRTRWRLWAQVREELEGR